jgi:hypothetical protein
MKTFLSIAMVIGLLSFAGCGGDGDNNRVSAMSSTGAWSIGHPGNLFTETCTILPEDIAAEEARRLLLVGTWVHDPDVRSDSLVTLTIRADGSFSWIETNAAYPDFRVSGAWTTCITRFTLAGSAGEGASALFVVDSNNLDLHFFTTTDEFIYVHFRRT